MPVFGAVEVGGTKILCAVGTGPEDLKQIRFPTTAPTETIEQVVAFFRAQPEPVKAVGIGSFGPVDLNPASPQFGWITGTPKPGWSNTDLGGAIRRALGVPVGFDTDVNAAALGEHRWGAAAGLETFIYLTVGTGIGGGGLVGGRLMHGLLHPEMGHVRIPHDWTADPFEGSCPFHGDCLEGLASGVAMAQRWGRPGAELPPDHPGWDLEVGYLAHALVNYICVLSPERIILGGGVMQQAHLFPRIRSKVTALLNGYVQAEAVLKRMEEYIVPPGLGDRAGVLGALALAEGYAR